MGTTMLVSSIMATGHNPLARASDPFVLGSAHGERATSLFIVLTVVLIVAWIFVLLRAYVRAVIIKNVAADDWWMLASMIAYTGYSIEAMYGIIYGGTGRHLTELTTHQIYIGLKCWYISEILYAPLSAMVRTSVALFILRVSVEQWHKRVVLVNLSIVYLITIVFMFVVTFQCDPPSYFYDQVLGLEGHCMDITVVPYVTFAHSAIGAVCDLVFASLPIAMLWNVQLNKRTKAVIGLLLGMGFVAGIALLVRIPFVKVLALSSDFLYETIDVAIWSAMEPSLGIIAGCLATLRPLSKGFGIGRNTTHEYYINDYRSSSSRFTRSQAGRRSLRLKNLGGGGLSSPDTELATPGLKDDAVSIYSSTWPLTVQMEPLTFPQPSVKTNIVSSRDSLAAEHAANSGSQSISVHTTIRTESIYEGISPTKESK